MRRAFFWIADADHLHEVKRSAGSVKRFFPNADRIWLTPQDVTKCDLGWEDRAIEVTPKYDQWYLNSVYWWSEIFRLPYDDFCYLDSDTEIIAECEELFDILQRFDMALTHAPARQTAPTVSKIPDSFPEFNIGVVVFRNNAYVKQLCAEWLALYEKYADVYGNNDQAPLREALWQSSPLGDNEQLLIATLPPEFNCKYGYGGFAAGKVRIVHSHGDNSKFINSINQTQGMRSWKKGEYS